MFTSLRQDKLVEDFSGGGLDVLEGEFLSVDLNGADTVVGKVELSDHVFSFVDPLVVVLGGDVLAGIDRRQLHHQDKIRRAKRTK